MTTVDYPQYIYPPFAPYLYKTCTCGSCPVHYNSTVTTFTLPSTYVPKHRKPGPAR